MLIHPSKTIYVLISSDEDTISIEYVKVRMVPLHNWCGQHHESITITMDTEGKLDTYLI